MFIEFEVFELYPQSDNKTKRYININHVTEFKKINDDVFVIKMDNGNKSLYISCEEKELKIKISKTKY